MLIDYSRELVFTQTLDLVDPGCVGLICESDQGGHYLLATKTVMGTINIVTAGPVLLDAPDVFLDGFKVAFDKFKWSEKKLAKSIATFINDPQKEIKAIETVPETEVISLLPDLSIIFDNL